VSLAITDDDEPNVSYTVEAFSDRIGGADIAAVVRTQSVTGNGTHNITGISYQGGAQYVYLRIRQADGDRAWTAPVWLEPDLSLPDTDTDTDTTISVSLVVNEQAETARITNTGSSPVELTGWKLVSVRGNQVFDQFPDGMSLAPGQSVTVTSGAGAATGNGFLRWTDRNIWNDAGDPGRLLDKDGNVVAEAGR
jgi:hypothetical protein